MTTIPVLRGTTRADLLALPSFLFEFHPTESVVVLGMCGSTVGFSARLDVGWFQTHFDQVADQVANASSQLGGGEFILLGYSEDPDLAWASVTEAAGVVGHDAVVEALVTDGDHYWSLTDGEGPTAYDFESSAVAARAVYEGINVHSSREEAVAPVTTWSCPDEPAIHDAREEISALGHKGAMARLGMLAESDPPVQGDDALLLACLLEDEERAAEVLARLKMPTAERIWHNLAAARRVAPPSTEAMVVALLGIASWLAGRGAQATACLERLQGQGIDHPIAKVLSTVHHNGIPPQRWDE